MNGLVSITQDAAGKYRELAAKKCHHVPKPTVELQRICSLAECPTRTTPPVHRWNMFHHTYPPQPLPQPPSRAEWYSSPWSQVHKLIVWFMLVNNWQELPMTLVKRRFMMFTVSNISVWVLCALQCTVTCGGGVQARTVQCLVGGKPSPGCALHLKPSMSQACNTNFCPQPEKKGTDNQTKTAFPVICNLQRVTLKGCLGWQWKKMVVHASWSVDFSVLDEETDPWCCAISVWAHV